MSQQSLFTVSPDDGLLGVYQYLNLHSYIRHWPPVPKSKIRIEASLEERFYLSLARYAYIHETRHFHDFFGTLTGALLFFTHFRMVRALVTMMEMSRRTDERWLLPFPDWTETSKFMDVYRQHVRSWREYSKAAAKLTDAFRPRSIIKSFPNEYVVYVATSTDGALTAAFPFDVGIPEKNLRLTVLYPLSLTALLEGNAQALQRSMAEAEFSPEVAQEFTTSEIGQLLWQDHENPREPLDEIADSIQPYNVTDLMVSKYLRVKKGGHQTFKREAIMRLTDITLSSCRIEATEEDDLTLPITFDVSNVGMEFVRQMERTSPEDLTRGKIEYPEIVLEAYSQLLNHLTSIPLPETLSYNDDLSSPLDLLESTIAHHIMAPLLKARIETNHAVFYSTEEYMRFFSQLPSVPVLEHEGGLTFAPYMTDAMCDAWGKYVFLSHTLAQMINGDSILTCPRSDKTLGHIGHADFSISGGCDEHIANGECRGWYPERPSPLPNCLFSSMLSVFRRGEINWRRS